MPPEDDSPALGARVPELADELAQVTEVIARIEASLPTIDPDDSDRLNAEGGRLAVMRQRKVEIEAELATSPKPLSLRVQPLGPATLYALALLPDGSGVLTDGADGLILHDPRTGATIRTYSMPGYRRSVAVSPDGRYVAGRSYDHGTLVFHRETGQQVRAFADIRNQANLALVAGTGGTSLLVGVLEGQGRMRVRFSAVTGGDGYTVGGGFSNEIVFLAVSPDGRTLLASDSVGRTLLFGLPGGAPNDCPNLGGGAITAAAFAVGGSAVALGDYGGNVAVGTITESSPGHPRFHEMVRLTGLAGDGVHDLAFSPDGRLLAVRGIARVLLFDVGAGRPPVQVAVYEGVGGVDVVARKTLGYLPDGRGFVVAGYNGLFRGDTTAFLSPAVLGDPA